MLAGALEKAIWSLSKDQVSGVLESPSGLHIVKITEVQPAALKPLDQVRDEITAEIRKQIAASRFAEMATKLTETVYDQRDSLQPAADALGLKLRTATGIARDGLLPAEQAGEGAAAASPDAQLLDNPRVRQALFSSEVLREKQNSGVIELSPDTMLAVRVSESKPEHVPPLEKVSDLIRDRLVGERAAEAARQAATAALEGWKADPATVPEGFAEAIVVSRQQPGQLSQPVLEAAMRLPTQPLPAYTGVADGDDYVVVRLEKIEPGTADASARDLLARQLGAAWGQAEDAAVMKMLRDKYQVKILPEAASVLQSSDQSAG